MSMFAVHHVLIALRNNHNKYLYKISQKFLDNKLYATCPIYDIIIYNRCYFYNVLYYVVIWKTCWQCLIL